MYHACIRTCRNILYVHVCVYVYLRNSECHTCPCAARAGAALAVGARGFDLGRCWIYRARSLEESGAGPSGGGGGIFNHKVRGQARWAFRAWRSGGNVINRTHKPRTVGERG